MANKRFLDFTTDVSPSGSNFLLEADSVNGVRKTTIENAVAGTNVITNLNSKVTDVFYNNSAAHNGIFRGKDLTAYFDSGEMSTAIANGTFDDIFIGDYIIKTIVLPAITYTDKSGTSVTQEAQTFGNVYWIVAGLDVHLYCGDIKTTNHHIVLIPDVTLQQNVSMNPTNATTGAYLGSDMWKVHMSNWSTAIKNAFGSSHVLSHRENLTSDTNNAVQSAGAGLIGKSSSREWTNVEVNIPNENMIFGSSIYGSPSDAGDFPKILPLYAHKGYTAENNAGFSLRTVASNEYFVCAHKDGNAALLGAGMKVADLGIRPYFLLK